jgi:two-component SAPR family response regulator
MKVDKKEMIDEIKNNILNNYGGVKEFVRNYGGDSFNEELVNWFLINNDYHEPKVEVFIKMWKVCFPSI